MNAYKPIADRFDALRNASWRLFALGLTMVIASMASHAHAAQERQPVTLDHLEGVQDGANADFVTLDISANGKWLAIAGRESLQVIDAANGQVAADLGTGQAPCWSPAGTALAFYSARSGAMQLWAWDAASGAVRPLTAFPRGVDPDPRTRITGPVIDAFGCAWSPDGERIVIASRVPYPLAPSPEGAPLVLDRSTAPELTLRGVFARPAGATGGVPESPDGRLWLYRPPEAGRGLASRLYLVNARTGVVELVEGGKGSLFHPQWSPDGRRLAFAAIGSEADLLTAPSGEIRVRDMSDGREKVVASGADLKYRPRWSPDGQSIVYLAGSAAVSPSVEVVDLHDESRRVHPFSGRIRKLDWTRAGDGFVLSFNDGATSGLGRLSLSNGRFEPVGDGAIFGWAQAGDGAIIWSNWPRGAEVWRKDADADLPARIAVIEGAADSAELRLGRVETIAYRSADGHRLEGALLYPPDYESGRSYPMIVDVYPMQRNPRWMSPIMGNQAWAAAGYLVFKPLVRAPHTWVNCSGPPDFCAASRGPAGWDTGVADAMNGIDAVVARGLADPARVCLYGFSNGGGMAAYLATSTDRFRCVVIVAPALPNWIGSPLLSTESWSMLTEWAGRSPLDAPQDYLALSAVYRADRVTAPVFLAVGDNDGIFMLGSVELYNALRHAGADVTFLRYPGQGHVFRGAALRDLWAREMAFFETHLMPFAQQE